MVSWWVLLPIKRYDSTRKGLGREMKSDSLGGYHSISLKLICGNGLLIKKDYLAVLVLAGKGLEKMSFSVLSVHCYLLAKIILSEHKSFFQLRGFSSKNRKVCSYLQLPNVAGFAMK